MTKDNKTISNDTHLGNEGCELTILIPCLNESKTIGLCIEKAKDFLVENEISGEILVADNGSRDDSRLIAIQHQARVIEVTEKGYGSALMGGISAAKGRYIIMGDGDYSYDFSKLVPFVRCLRQGFQLVIGNRFRGGIQPGAMPFLHRYLGNPILSKIGQLFFKTPVGDFHCGLRGFNREAIMSLDLRSTGMEFATEMVVKASINGLIITEVPTILSPDGRDRKPHLRTWRDGWRHLRFLLLYSPQWLFLFPGLVLLTSGLFLLVWLMPGPKTFFGINLDVHTMLFGASASILGVQSISFAFFAKLYGIKAGFLGPDSAEKYLSRVPSLETLLIIGFLIFMAGITGSLAAIFTWGNHDFGDLIPSAMMRLVIPSITAMVIGAQIAISAFMLSVLQIPIHISQRVQFRELKNRNSKKNH